MSRPCILEGGKCDEEAQPGSPFCPAHGREHNLTHSFTYCERHETVYLSHFNCPACVLQDLGFHMEVTEGEGRYMNRNGIKL